MELFSAKSSARQEENENKTIHCQQIFLYFDEATNVKFRSNWH